MATAVAAVTATLVLTACGGDHKQASQPPPLAKLLATPTTSPTPLPPTLAVIKAAVQAYVDGMNTVLKDGDPTAAYKATTSSCACRDQVKKIADLYDQHAKFVGAHLVVLRITPISATPTTAEARLSTRLPPSTYETARGKKHPVRAIPASRVIVKLVNDHGRWLVSAVDEPTSASAKPRPTSSAKR